MRSKFIIILAVVLLAGCKTKYVSVPEYHTEYKTRTDSFIQRDSVLVLDSVFMWMAGDTVYKEKYKTVVKDRWRDHYITDTVIKKDSVRVPYPVEKSLSLRQRVEQSLGMAFAFIILAAIVIALIKRIRP